MQYWTSLNLTIHSGIFMGHWLHWSCFSLICSVLELKKKIKWYISLLKSLFKSKWVNDWLLSYEEGGHKQVWPPKISKISVIFFSGPWRPDKNSKMYIFSEIVLAFQQYIKLGIGASILSQFAIWHGMTISCTWKYSFGNIL